MHRRIQSRISDFLKNGEKICRVQSPNLQGLTIPSAKLAGYQHPRSLPQTARKMLITAGESQILVCRARPGFINPRVWRSEGRDSPLHHSAPQPLPVLRSRRAAGSPPPHPCGSSPLLPGARAANQEVVFPKGRDQGRSDRRSLRSSNTAPGL